MESIGQTFRETRESSGVTLEEASQDLNIKLEFLLNIEEGKIGCFKDIFVLKEYLINYAKYLGLDSDKLIDDFNEYMFEYTSKIPIAEIERQIEEQKSIKDGKDEISSPYTKESRKHNKSIYVFLYSVLVLLVIMVVFWCVKQITINKATATFISYVK